MISTASFFTLAKINFPSASGTSFPLLKPRPAGKAEPANMRWLRVVLGLRDDLFEFDVRSQLPSGAIDLEHPNPLPPTVQRNVVSPKASVVLTPVEPLSAKQIKALREREHVSQTVFANYLNVTPNLVSKWERGVRDPIQNMRSEKRLGTR